MGVAIVVLSFFYGPQLKDALLKVHIVWVMAGLGCYSVNYGLRAMRLQLLTQGRIRWWPEGLYASCVHGFSAYMLPFRSGELALPLVLRNLIGLNLIKGSRVLLRARLLDIHTLGLWVIIVALLTDISLPTAIRVGWLMVGGGMLVAPAVIKRLAVAGSVTRISFVKKLSGLMDLEPMNAREWLISLMIWFAVAGVIFCAAQAVGLDIDLKNVWLLITLQLPLQLIPVQGIANAGNHEGGWVAGLMMLGFSAQQSLEFALISHFILIFYVLVLGPIGLLAGRFCQFKFST